VAKPNEKTAQYVKLPLDAVEEHLEQVQSVIVTTAAQAEVNPHPTVETAVPKAKGKTPTAVKAKKTVAEIVAQAFPKKATKKERLLSKVQIRILNKLMKKILVRKSLNQVN